MSACRGRSTLGLMAGEGLIEPAAWECGRRRPDAALVDCWPTWWCGDWSSTAEEENPNGEV